MRSGFLLPNALNARDVRRRRTLLAVDDFEGDLVADLKVVEHDALQFVGVKEKVLRLAFAGDETESLVQQSLDSTCHSSFLVAYTSTFARILLQIQYLHYTVKGYFMQIRLAFPPA